MGQRNVHRKETESLFFLPLPWRLLSPFLSPPRCPRGCLRGWPRRAKERASEREEHGRWVVAAGNQKTDPPCVCGMTAGVAGPFPLRKPGVPSRRKADELYDNNFTAHLEKSGFLKELWGNELAASGR